MELFLNFAVWISAALFSIYKVYEFGKDVDRSLFDQRDFVPGWSFIGGLKDASDYEWLAWKHLALDISIWIFINSFISELIRSKIIYLKVWYCISSFAFITSQLGFIPLLLMIVQPIIYYTVVRIDGKTKSVWQCSCAFLFAINALKYIYEMNHEYFYDTLRINEENIYIMLVAISWIQLRCISYSLDVIELKENEQINTKVFKDNTISVLNILSYCFYLPLLFLGPVILYHDFKKSFTYPPKFTIGIRLYNLILNLTRYIGWFLFLELSLHFIYFNALQFNIEIVNMMPEWCLYGGGLWMGLYFYLKYLIAYGISGSLSALDNVTPETPPLCIARVHLYSQMWKYFDIGLHKFLIRYIYKPLIKDIDRDHSILLPAARCFASFLCFAFVLFWHGAHYFILIWTLLNYLGIVTENIGLSISKSILYKNIFKSKSTKQRFHAFISTPVLIVSALSNFYFFAGSDIGHLYAKRFVNQSWSSFVFLYACLYCCCRVSQRLCNVRTRRIL